MKTRLLACAALLAAVSISVPWWTRADDEIAWNQRVVEEVFARHDALTRMEKLAVFVRTLAGVWDRWGRTMPGVEEVDFENPRSVLKYVLAHAPSRAVVYPTETYYYYQFALGTRLVGGNIRLLDADSGRIHIGYFDVHDRRDVRKYTFTEADGVMVRAAGESTYDVAIDDRSVRFTLFRRSLERPSSLQLSEGEELVSGILDESGVAFVLIFNRSTGGFYYLTNDDFPLQDTPVSVEKIDDAEVLYGQRTRFIYLRCSARTYLIGVNISNISQNNYFDGPFDQVPPRLPLRERLELAYPYVSRRGGIDEHGNFNSMAGQRVAISPYIDYTRVEDVVAKVRDSFSATEDHVRRIEAITFEDKRIFHKKLDAEPLARTPIYVRQAWPANHQASFSNRWSSEHASAESATWPPNHDREVSASRAD